MYLDDDCDLIRLALNGSKQQNKFNWTLLGYIFGAMFGHAIKTENWILLGAGLRFTHTLTDSQHAAFVAGWRLFLERRGP